MTSTYVDYDRASTALARHLTTPRGRWRQWWAARRGRVLTVTTTRAACGCVVYRITTRPPEPALWRRR